MPVTLRDVAAKAGVSPVVVSRVLHNRAQSIRVSEATAERVRQAAKDLGYRLNITARNFRQGQTNMIGVLHGVRFDRPLLDQGSRYFAALMDGLVEGAFRHEYAITLCPRLYGKNPEDAMADGRFDGLVWYSTQPSEENQEMLHRCTVPLVTLHGTEPAPYPNVICDNEGGVALAIDHLVDLGHRKICFAIDNRTLNGEFLLRYHAFEAHLARHGIEAAADDVVGLEGGLEEIARTIRDRRHSAIFAQEDELAAKIIGIAQAEGIDVPGQLSVVGFDSTSFCEQVHPRLTSVRQPLAEMGSRAIDLLVSVIRSEPIEERNVVIPCTFDIRESTTLVKQP